MASKTNTAISGSLHYVDSAPRVERHNDLVLIEVVSGGEVTNFGMSRHAALAMLMRVPRVLNEMSAQPSNIVQFPKRKKGKR